MRAKTTNTSSHPQVSSVPSGVNSQNNNVREHQPPTTNHHTEQSRDERQKKSGEKNNREQRGFRKTLLLKAVETSRSVAFARESQSFLFLFSNLHASLPDLLVAMDNGIGPSSPSSSKSRRGVECEDRYQWHHCRDMIACSCGGSICPKWVRESKRHFVRGSFGSLKPD